MLVSILLLRWYFIVSACAVVILYSKLVSIFNLSGLAGVRKYFWSSDFENPTVLHWSKSSANKRLSCWKSCAQRKIEYVKEVILRYSPGKALDLSIFFNRENYFQKAGHRMQQMQFPPRLFSVCDLSPFVNRSIHSGFSLYPQNHCRRATYLCESSLCVWKDAVSC